MNDHLEPTPPGGAITSFSDAGIRALKSGETFATFERNGDVAAVSASQLGLYHRGTRYLSRYRLLFDQHPLVLLTSYVFENNLVLSIESMNAGVAPEHARSGEVIRGTLHIKRHLVLDEGVLVEKVTITNYGPHRIRAPISLDFACDYQDIFEVRGQPRARRGESIATRVLERSVVQSYRGLDDILRSTRITFSLQPTMLGEQSATFLIALEPREAKELEIEVRCEEGEVAAFPVAGFHLLQTKKEDELRGNTEEQCDINTSNELCNLWIQRSLSDLRMMLTQKPTGPYPYAGVPWFSTSFGRDGILTAYQTLWFAPSLSKGVLCFLAQEQARGTSAKDDAEPGKILHESRNGEMASLGEVPFARYFGSVDSTPLFLVLAGEYLTHTGDVETLRTLWPQLRLAYEWIEKYGDVDGDGFVEYSRASDTGLIQQGWKDSHDSVFHEDGSDAPGPIALCEVQAYVYAACRGFAQIARALGDQERALHADNRADQLFERFDAAFWLPELETYALALDGNKKPCRVRTSNAGHCLFTGIARPERASRLAESLFRPDMFSGWGVRTLSSEERRYNPMSYHNGSIWPHDNSLIALGLSRYGFKEQALRIFEGLFSASMHLDLHRLPELFCGFSRASTGGPTAYPVACSPQAWSAAAVCMLLSSLLGLRIDAQRQCVELHAPILPESIHALELKRLRVGDGLIDLQLTRQEHDVAINVSRRDPQTRVAVLK